MKEPSYKTIEESAAHAIDNLRRAAQAEDMTKKSMAAAIGISRPTLGARFNDGDMKLSEFLKLSFAAGKTPSEMLKCCDAMLTAKEQGNE